VAGAEGIVQAPLELGRSLKKEGEYILEGFLVCSNKECRSEYPILDGVPIVLKDIQNWWNSEKHKITSTTFEAPELTQYFDTLDESEALSFAERSLLSSYLDLHYGAHDEVSASSDSWLKSEEFWKTVIGLAEPDNQATYECALDMGCSVGRYTFEIAGFTEMTIGIDLSFNMLSTAAKIQRTKNIAYERRTHGRFFKDARSSYSPPSQNVFFVLADCLEPPFSAESFDLIGALNLLDNVKLPLVLIGQMDALLRPGGKLVMGSPYEWRPEICEPREWLESAGLDGPAMVRKILEGNMVPQMELIYEILEELRDVPWVLRHHDRHWSTFLLHLIKARKNNEVNRAN
jgi:SAM-dependent methyltransferase/uncharacterized protein YbaR (Trm112 family)